MTLTRTNSGLQNLHILKGVDLIVYTEGGDKKTFSKEEILAGEGHQKSVDIRFWKKVFACYLPDKKVKVLSVGSCNTLNQIALDISGADLRNVCVAMDRDYSVFWANTFEHQRVVRTRTYSWENELFQTDIIFRAFERLALEAIDEVEIRQLIDDARNILLGQLKHLLRADLVLVAANKSLFCRKKPASCFKHVRNQSSPPVIDSERMKARLRSQRAEIGPFNLVCRPGAASIDTARDIFGKPLLIASVRILQFLILRAKQKPIANDYLEKFLLETFFDWIANNPRTEIAKAYANKLSIISDAA